MKRGKTTRFTVAGNKKPTPVKCRKVVGPNNARCNWRTTLPKQLAEYKRPPKCGRCGALLVHMDFWRVRNEWKVKPCTCYGYAYPHARGRGYCDHNPKLTAEDLRLRAEGGPGDAPDDDAVPF
jgi:hypothetical protein